MAHELDINLISYQSSVASLVNPDKKLNLKTEQSYASSRPSTKGIQ